MDVMQGEQSVFSDRGRAIFRGAEANMVAVEITARGIRRSERVEIAVHLRGRARSRRIILGDGLHRPFQSVARGILHSGAKTDARRVGIQTNRPLKLNSRPGIGRAREFYFTALSFRNLSKGVWPVID